MDGVGELMHQDVGLSPVGVVLVTQNVTVHTGPT